MIYVYPAEQTKDIVIESAQKAGLPVNGVLFDARPHMVKLVEVLYANGYVLARLEDGPTTRKIAQKLNSNEVAKLNG